jgi:hypothetical protein
MKLIFLIFLGLLLTSCYWATSESNNLPEDDDTLDPKLSAMVSKCEKSLC